MRRFNQALLLSRLTAPPEQLQTKNGKLFLRATSAVTVAQKTGEGVNEERTSFIPATIFGRQAEVFLKYVQKGEMVHLVGRLDSNEWKTESGEKRLSLSFVVAQLNLLSNARQTTVAENRVRQPKPREVNTNEFGEPENIPF